MNRQEANEVIERLSTRLREVGLGWVVDAAVEEIRLGREIMSSEPIQVPGSKRFQKPSADSLTTVPLTPDEEVGVLVEATRRAVIDVAALEVALAGRFRAEAEQANIAGAEVKFVPPGDTQVDGDGQNRNGFRVPLAGPSPDRLQAVATLVELLGRLAPGADDAG